MSKVPMRVMWMYTGLADAEGIESFYKADDIDKQTYGYMNMRCIANSHRDALIYRVILFEAHAKIIGQLMDQQKYKAALVFLKQQALHVEVLKSHEHSWDKIPTLTQKEWEEIDFLKSQAVIKQQDEDQMTLFEEKE